MQKAIKFEALGFFPGTQSLVVRPFSREMRFFLYRYVLPGGRLLLTQLSYPGLGHPLLSEETPWLSPQPQH